MSSPDAPSPPDDPSGDELQLHLIGQTLLGCKIESVIGSGAIGTVFLARHLQLGRPRAIKVLKPRMLGDPEMVQRFMDEACNAARIEHENLVRLHNADDVQGHFVIVMEYVEGQTLFRLVEQGGPLDPHEAAGLMIQAARGLAAAHGAGIIHRDITPDNLLLSRDGKIKIADFGLARGGGPGLTETGHAVGTPPYMSPEQCRGQAAGPTSDIYSLGLVGYYLLTGTEPMLAETSIATMYRQVNFAIEPPHKLRPEIGPPLSSVVCRMLAKEPADRPSTACDLIAELEAALAGNMRPSPAQGAPALRRRQVTDRRTSRSRRPASPAPRRFVTPPVLGLLAGLLLLGGLLAYYATSRKAPPAKQPVSPADLDQQYLKAMLAGDLQAAYQLQAKLLAVRPGDWNLRRRRVELATELKRPDDAIAELLALERGDKLFAGETRNLLALQLQTGQIEPAKQLVERVFSRDPALWRELCLQVASRLEPQPAIQYLDRANARAPHPDISNQIARRQLAAGHAPEAARIWLAIAPEAADPQFLTDLKQASRKDFPPELLLQLAHHDAGFFSFQALAGWLAAKPERVEGLAPELLEKLLFEACRDRKWDAVGQAAGKALAAKEPARSKRLADQARKDAIASFKAGRHREHVRQTTCFLALQPRAVDAWFYRGVSYRHLGQEELALADYNQALRVQPGYPPALKSRGLIRLDRAEYAAAIRDFTGAIDRSAPKDPYLPFYLANRGFAYLLAEQPEKGIPDFKRAAALRPHPVFDLGDALAAAAGNRTPATLAPLAGVLSRGGGKMLAGVGGSRADIKIATRLIALLPGHPLALVERGNLHLKRGQRAEAIRDLEQALALCRGEHAAHRPAVEQALAASRNKR